MNMNMKMMVLMKKGDRTMMRRARVSISSNNKKHHVKREKRERERIDVTLYAYESPSLFTATRM